MNYRGKLICGRSEYVSSTAHHTRSPRRHKNDGGDDGRLGEDDDGRQREDGDGRQGEDDDGRQGDDGSHQGNGDGRSLHATRHLYRTQGVAFVCLCTSAVLSTYTTARLLSHRAVAPSLLSLRLAVPPPSAASARRRVSLRLAVSLSRRLSVSPPR